MPGRQGAAVSQSRVPGHASPRAQVRSERLSIVFLWLLRRGDSSLDGANLPEHLESPPGEADAGAAVDLAGVCLIFLFSQVKISIIH